MQETNYFHGVRFLLERLKQRELAPSLRQSRKVDHCETLLQNWIISVHEETFPSVARGRRPSCVSSNKTK